METNWTPGPGWNHAGGAVYDHSSGVRIHVLGFCRINGEFIDGNRYPESRRLDFMVRVNGGNRKRGVMAWALAKARGETDV